MGGGGENGKKKEKPEEMYMKKMKDKNPPCDSFVNESLVECVCVLVSNIDVH